MTVLADIVARFTADTSGLESGADAVISKMSRMEDSSANLGGGFISAGTSAASFGKDVGESSALVDQLAERVKNLAGLAIGIYGFKDLFQMTKDAVSEAQVLGVQYKTTFGVDAAQSLDTATKFAQQYGVSISSSANAYQDFAIATKGHKENLIADQKVFQDAAAGTGESLTQVEGAVSNYFQLVQRLGTTGGLGARALTPLLTSHIIDPDTYNMLRQMANAGADPQQLLNTILQNAESQYGGAAAGYAKTIPGRLQSVRDTMMEDLNKAAQPIVGGTGGLLEGLQKGLESQGFQQGLQTAGKDAERFLQVLVQVGRVAASAGAEIGHIAADIAPAAGAVLGLAEDLLKIAEKGPVAKDVIIGLVAAFVAIKAIKFADNIITDINMMITKFTQGETATQQLIKNFGSQKAAVDVDNMSMRGLNETIAQQTTMMQEELRVMENLIAGTNRLSEAQATAAGSTASDTIAQARIAAKQSIQHEQVGMAGNMLMIPTTEQAALASGSMWTRLKYSLSNTAAPMEIGGAAAIGGLGLGMAGQAVGGTAGNAMTGVGSVVGMAGMGAVMGSMIGPEGTAIGGVIGGVAGGLLGLTSALHLFGNSVSAVDQQVKKASDDFINKHPLNDPTSIDTAFQLSKHSFHESFQKMVSDVAATQISGGATPNIRQLERMTTAQLEQAGVQAGQMGGLLPGSWQQDIVNLRTAAREQAYTSGGEFNMGQNVKALQSMVPGLSASDAVNKLSDAGINLSENFQKTGPQVLDLANQILHLGGAAQLAAEALANTIQTLGQRLVGAQGEAFSSLSPDQYKQIVGLANQYLPPGAAGPMLQAYGLGTPPPSTFNRQGPTGAITTEPLKSAALAQQEAADMAMQQQRTDALHQVTQASWAEVDAQNALAAASFQATQAQFQADRAALQLGWTHSTEANAVSALQTAISSGFVPVAWDATTVIQQLSTADAALAQQFMTDLNALRQIETLHQQLNIQYQQAAGALQVLNDQLKQLQDIANQPVQGTAAYNQQQQQFKEAEASVQRQIDIMKGNLIPSQDPRMIQLNTELAALQNAQDIATQSANMGPGGGPTTVAQIDQLIGPGMAAALAAGLQQAGIAPNMQGGVLAQAAQIQLAQAQPEVDYQTALAAAQNIGQLNVSIHNQQVVVDNLKPSLDALNTQYDIESQKVNAEYSAVQTLAQGRQNDIIQTNALYQAQQQLLQSKQAVVDAFNAQTAAGWAFNDAVSQQQQAENAAEAKITTDWQNMISSIVSAITLGGQSVAGQSNAVTQQLQQNMEYVTALIQATGSNNTNAMNFLEKIGPSGFAAWVKANGGNIPQYQSGGVVPGSPTQSTLAMLHGQEVVIPYSVVASGIPISVSSGGGTLSVNSGAIQVTINATGTTSPTDIADEVASAVNTALQNLVDQWAATGTPTNG